MKLAQAIDFQQIIRDAFPGYSPPPKGIDITDPNLTLGGIISAFLPHLFIGAGLFLFVYLIIGGFELLTSAGNPETIAKAKGKITHALVGFIIIFVSYWLIQILEIVFGITILG